MAINFREPTLADAETVLSWRTKPRVTNYMNTDIKNDLDAQRLWLESCDKRHDYYHWIVEFGGEPAGMVSIDQLDLDHNHTSWGFYIGDDRFLNMGGVIPPYLYNWLFFQLELDVVWAAVLSFNTDVIALHEQHGYITDRCDKAAVEKNGQHLDLQHMYLKKQAWGRLRRYHRMRADFPIKSPSSQVTERFSAIRRSQ